MRIAKHLIVMCICLMPAGFLLESCDGPLPEIIAHSISFSVSPSHPSLVINSRPTAQMNINMQFGNFITIAGSPEDEEFLVRSDTLPRGMRFRINDTTTTRFFSKPYFAGKYNENFTLELTNPAPLPGTYAISFYAFPPGPAGRGKKQDIEITVLDETGLSAFLSPLPAMVNVRDSVYLLAEIFRGSGITDPAMLDISGLPPNVIATYASNPTPFDKDTIVLHASANADSGIFSPSLIVTAGTARDTVNFTLIVIDTPSDTLWSTVLDASSATLLGMDVNAPSGIVIGTSEYKTVNSGVSWSLVSGFPPILLRDASIFGNTAIAVGGGGHIYRSTDGGLTWTDRVTSTTNQFNGVDLTNSNIGLAVGALGTIRRTTNGGGTWTSQASSTSEALIDVSFNGSTATIVGTVGTILRSTDIGITWVQQVSGTASHLRGVTFVNDNDGFAVGDFGTILKTTNGGSQWIQLNSGTSESLMGVGVANSQQVTVGGTNGLILQTTDGGTTWTQDTAPAQYIYVKIHVFPNNSALCLGQGSSGSIILRRGGGLAP